MPSIWPSEVPQHGGSLGRRALLQTALFPMPDRQMAADGLSDFSFSGWCLMESLNSSTFV